MDISEKVEQLEDQLKGVNNQIEHLDNFVKGDEMILVNHSSFTELTVQRSDLKDGFIERKWEKLRDEKEGLEKKLNNIKEILN